LLLVYFALVFAGGALLAPWLYWLAQWAAGQWPACAGLAAHPFHRFLDRSLLGLALLGLWPLLRGGGIRSWGDLGFPRQGRPALQALRGFSLGWASLAAAVLLAWLAGARAPTLTHSAGELSRFLLGAALTAVVVAVLEEMVFRGALFGLLRQSMPWPAALVVSSAVYSAVHFIKTGQTALPVQWYSGLGQLWELISHPPPLIPALLTLFVAGAALGLAYQRSGALYFSIGLHAGLVFWLLSFRFLFHPAGPVQSFWGGDQVIDGWLSLIILTAVFAVIARKRPIAPA
jgi:membrane protease YdiL (CAAX protease family)